MTFDRNGEHLVAVIGEFQLILNTRRGVPLIVHRGGPALLVPEQGIGWRQLVLNLDRPEVFDYLIEQLDALFAGREIAYVKRDMNRDLVRSADGIRAAMHAHMHRVYALIDGLRRRHPRVEIESCASGCARAYFEILKRTERIWTSDSTDELERQRIQHGFSLVFPPEVMGAHIRPPRSHSSCRTHSLGFRAATAYFGHLGVEWNRTIDPRRCCRPPISTCRSDRSLRESRSSGQQSAKPRGCLRTPR